jgi:hypothetical protein
MLERAGSERPGAYSSELWPPAKWLTLGGEWVVLAGSWCAPWLCALSRNIMVTSSECEGDSPAAFFLVLSSGA